MLLRRSQGKVALGIGRQPQKTADHRNGAQMRLATQAKSNGKSISAVPDEPYPDESASGALSASVLYGLKTWGDLFAPRQSLALVSFSRLVRQVTNQIEDRELAAAVVTCLAFCVSKLADYLSSLCAWRTARSCAAHTFVRQALPMTWDFAEMNPFAGSSGDWSEAVRYLALFIEANFLPFNGGGVTQQSSATVHPLPDDTASVFAPTRPITTRLHTAISRTTSTSGYDEFLGTRTHHCLLGNSQTKMMR